MSDLVAVKSLQGILELQKGDSREVMKKKRVWRVRYRAIVQAEFGIFKNDVLNDEEFFYMVKEITGGEVTEKIVREIWSSSDSEWSLNQLNKIFMANEKHIEAYCDKKCGEYGCIPANRGLDGGCEPVLEYIVRTVGLHRKEAFQFMEILEHYKRHYYSINKAMASWFKNEHDARFRNAHHDNILEIEAACDAECGRGLCFARPSKEFPRMWECRKDYDEVHRLLHDGPGDIYEGCAPADSEKMFFGEIDDEA